MCTHAAECSPAGSRPAEGSGSLPSPRWTPALSPPAVRLGPFPSSPTQDGRTDADSGPGLTSSPESRGPAKCSYDRGRELQQGNEGPADGPEIQTGPVPPEAAAGSY